MKFDIDYAIGGIKGSSEFFDRSTKVLTENDSSFAPTPEMMTVSQQVAHAARTIEWFIQGAFGEEGFDMNFGEHCAELTKVTSLEAARRELTSAFQHLVTMLQSKTEEDWAKPMIGPIMAGEPRSCIVPAIMEHTAHHRGALTVYSRLLKKVPPMPYMDAE